MVFREALAAMRTGLEAANRTLYREYGADRICGSTLVLLLCCQARYGIMYAGDSRAYLKKSFSFSRLTVDEVWENQPGLSERERRASDHPNRGKLTNAFGAEPELYMQTVTDELKGGELFLLCSDGLYKMCSDRQIRAAMGKARGGGDMMKLALMDLKQETEAAGAADNFSIIILKADKE